MFDRKRLHEYSREELADMITQLTGVLGMLVQWDELGDAPGMLKDCVDLAKKFTKGGGE